MPRKVLWILVAVGGAMALAGILMGRSTDPALYGKARIIGWTGIAIVLLARVFLAFGGRRNQPKKP